MNNILIDLISNEVIELDFRTILLIYLIEDDSKKSIARPIIDISTLTDQFCLENFRFVKNDIFELRLQLRIPEIVTTENRYKFSGIEGLCIVLRRLAYPNRLSDLSLIFNRSKASLSLIIKRIIEIIYNNHIHLITYMRRSFMTVECCRVYADRVHEMGAPLTNCIGFIDGTLRKMCRPSYLQKEVYNGHKRHHGIKFQSIVIPNGLILNLYGPISGRRHDSFMLSESNIVTQLTTNFENFCVYGDPAYPLRGSLQAPYRGSNLSENQKLFNKRMSEHRVVVEWVFGKIAKTFAFLDFEKNLKLFLQPIAKYYSVGAILTNCHTSIYNSQTGLKFNLNPPTLSEYLNS